MGQPILSGIDAPIRRARKSQSVFHKVRITGADNIAEMRAIMLAINGAPLCVVQKSRRLFLIGQTRVHLDRVERLGDFLELEVILGDGQTSEEGSKIARCLMLQLGVKEGDLVSESYADLLCRGG